MIKVLGSLVGAIILATTATATGASLAADQSVQVRALHLVEDCTAPPPAFPAISGDHAIFTWTTDLVENHLPKGAVSDLLAHGIIGGVGATVGETAFDLEAMRRVNTELQPAMTSGAGSVGGALEHNNSFH